jgi:hypothetical protein
MNVQSIALGTNPVDDELLDRSISDQASAALYEALPYPAKARDVIEYNDALDRTQAEIVALVDQAIAMMEGR